MASRSESTRSGKKSKLSCKRKKGGGDTQSDRCQNITSKSGSTRSGGKKSKLSCKRQKGSGDMQSDRYQNAPCRKDSKSKGKKSKLSCKRKKETREPLKDQCQVFTLDDAPTPSRTAKSSISAAESQRLEAIEAAERDIERDKLEIAREQQRIGRFWRNVNVQPISRYLLTLPPLSWSYISVIICCAVKVFFCLFIFSILLHSHDAPLVYMMCFIVVHIGSAFATIELLVLRTKKILFICAAVDVCVIAIVIILLAVISSDKEGEGIIPVERVAATTVVVAFLELLCLVHHFHVHYKKQAVKKPDIELPCTCRIQQPVDLSTSSKRTSQSRSSKRRRRSRTPKTRHHSDAQSSVCGSGSYSCFHGPHQAREIPIEIVSHEGAHEYKETPRGYTRCEFSCSNSSRPLRYVRNPYTGEIRRLSHSSL